MPVLFAPLVGLVIGVVLAWVSAFELAKDDGPVALSRPFAVTAAFAAFVYTPAVGYFAAMHGDWSYLYWIAWHRVPSAVDLALVLVGGASVIGGFFAAVPLVKKRRSGAVGAMAALPAAVVLAALVLTARRLGTSATFAQFHGDFGTEAISQSALGRGVLWMGIVMVAGIAWAVRSILAIADAPTGKELSRTRR
jgi:hypothetical protein